jgi:hypothetical protein
MPTEVQIYKDKTIVPADLSTGGPSWDSDGNVSINVVGGKFKGPLDGNADTATRVVGPTTIEGTSTADLVSGTMDRTDRFRIRIGGTGDDGGFAEIATANNGNEPIHVRQYTLTQNGGEINHFANITRTATLLDRDGNTSFPETVSAKIFSGSLTGNATSATSATSATTVSGITGNTGLVVDTLRAPGVSKNNIISDLTDGNFRSSMFGTTANGYALSAARWNEVPSALTGLSEYGTAIAWAGADTHGFLALNYDTAGAIIGGGNENKIRWKATLLHSLNYNNYSPSLTGNGASGSWGINITGSATSAGSATNATTATNVVGAENCILYNSGQDTTTTASTLTFNGTTNVLSCSGDIIAFASDERLKTNIKPIENAVDKISKLNGFTYNFNEIGEGLGFDTSLRHAGVSAQEVQAVLPEAVCPAPANDEYLTVKYDKLVPLLIEAIKELKEEIKELKGGK